VLKSVRDIHRPLGGSILGIRFIGDRLHARILKLEGINTRLGRRRRSKRSFSGVVYSAIFVIAIALVAINFAYLAWHHRHFDEEPVRYRICMIIAVISSILAASFIMLPAID